MISVYKISTFLCILLVFQWCSNAYDFQRGLEPLSLIITKDR